MDHGVKAGNIITLGVCFMLKSIYTHYIPDLIDTCIATCHLAAYESIYLHKIKLFRTRTYIFIA